VKRIEQLLSREIGLMARSIGSGAIEAAVRGRMASCRLATVDEYLERLEQNASERSALVEDIVVSETWFFRDESVFEDLAAFASGPWRKANPEGILRVLCVPCATGEEPYSAAIVLLEAGLPAARFQVLGVDVSQRALDRAHAAVYDKRAFRVAETRERARHFENVDDGRRVAQAARSSVTLIQGNVLDPSLVSTGARFDVIFCRNLLIYLDGPARARALENFWLWLAPEGIFFGGHAEAIEAMDPRFAHRADAGHCAYVRRRGAPRVSSVSSSSDRGAQSGLVLGAFGLSSKPVKAKPALPTSARALPSGPISSQQKLVPAVPVVVHGPPPGSLAKVTELADRGDPAAAATCERHIAEWGPSAEAYCLLGVIRNAAGAEQAAIEAFNRALYLQQSHYAALIHLALLHERRGESALASNFRRRADRVQQKKMAP
jgi:chemotaxis protein methyltransferase WspC